MNKSFVLLIVLLAMVLSSCQKSQFATTTRIYNNGRVMYAKKYHYDKRTLSQASSPKNEISGVEMRSTLYADNKTVVTPEIYGITRVAGIQTESRIAYTRLEPVLTLTKEGLENSDARQQTINSKSLPPDTIVKEYRKEAGQIETPPVDTRKTEKFGLSGFILSIAGLVPIICLPFAILGLIFGIISLRKIKQNPALYKGKGFAIASIILGVLGILGILLFIG